MNSHSMATTQREASKQKFSLYPLSEDAKSTNESEETLDARHHFVLQYLKDIPEERKNCITEIEKWRLEKSALVGRQQTLQNQLRMQYERINQLQAEIEVFKKSKEQTFSFLVPLLNLQQAVVAPVQNDVPQDPRLRQARNF